jgi:hypothetical protein
MLNLKKIEVYLPAHAHQALRIFAITEGKTASRVIVEAIDKAYPSLQVNELTPRPVSLNPPFGSHSRGNR